jgi:hypothetical protein
MLNFYTPRHGRELKESAGSISRALGMLSVGWRQQGGTVFPIPNVRVGNSLREH